MDDAESFVRDASSFTRRSVPHGPSDRVERRRLLLERAFIRQLARFFRGDPPEDPFAYSAVPNRPVRPRLRDSVRLPLP